MDDLRQGCLKGLLIDHLPGDQDPDFPITQLADNRTQDSQVNWCLVLIMGNLRQGYLKGLLIDHLPGDQDPDFPFAQPADDHDPEFPTTQLVEDHALGFQIE